MERKPAYLKITSHELKRRSSLAGKMLESCVLCPRNCKVNRIKGQKGWCQAPAAAVVANYFPHFGEEPQLVGDNGSGTIFFSHCNLHCVYCQNWEISQLGHGKIVSAGRLADIMLYLQSKNCHNINLVTPTHNIPFILEALVLAVDRGLSLPLVYNSGGYESLSSLQLLSSIIDIYLPDFKYWSAKAAEQFSGAVDYPEHAREAIKKMFKQVGNLVVDDNGVALSGLIVRHLLLPEDLAGTREVIGFIAKEISRHCAINIMDQYRPAYRACDYPQLQKSPNIQDLPAAKKMAADKGLRLIK